MPVTGSPDFGRTRRTPEEVHADAQAAKAYWASLEQLDDAARAAVIREGTRPDLPGNGPPADLHRPASLERATGHLPSPQVRVKELGAASEREHRERQLWLERIEHPTHSLQRRLRAEAAALAEELAHEPDLRPRYVRGEVHPVGMSYQRALEIAVACLAREEQLHGVAPTRHRRPGEALPVLSL
jgi:hypothetical protein